MNNLSCWSSTRLGSNFAFSLGKLVLRVERSLQQWYRGTLSPSFGGSWGDLPQEHVAGKQNRKYTLQEITSAWSSGVCFDSSLREISWILSEQWTRRACSATTCIAVTSFLSSDPRLLTSKHPRASPPSLLRNSVQRKKGDLNKYLIFWENPNTIS